MTQFNGAWAEGLGAELLLGREPTQPLGLESLSLATSGVPTASTTGP